MNEEVVIGIDMGGTWLRGALVSKGKLVSKGDLIPGKAASESDQIRGATAVPIVFRPIDNIHSFEEIWETLCDVIGELMNGNSIRAIGIGVPGLVDPGSGIVYDVLNIPCWKELPLCAKLEERFGLPVFVGNDANCFAWGEYISGKGRGSNSLIGLTIGTGLGAGIILDGKLYAGTSGSAGEFGMVDYLGRNYEYYASGSFFHNVHGLDGVTVFERAVHNDAGALRIYSEFGMHLGNAIRMILYTYDTGLIVLGGSVSKAWPFFRESLERTLASHAFARSLRRLKMEISELENGGIIGAAALCSLER